MPFARPSAVPFLDLQGYRKSDLIADLGAALAVTFMVVPQGIAYALIAGLPPYMGLYAAGLPVVVGSLLRSSRHSITGPTNALSVILGGSLIGAATTDASVGVVVATLCFLVGLLQISAAILRLGSSVDFISSPVLLGFTTGAGILIGVGQLPNVTRTASHGHTLLEKLTSWGPTVADAHLPSVGMALATAAVVLGLRRVDRRIPGISISIALATVVSMFSQDLGLKRVADIAPVPMGLPELVLPDLALVSALLPLAGACTVLSLVESSAIASAIATRTGQRLSLTTEFMGEGLANLTAAFFGGYPTSGSLSRSALNERAGARTRLAGVFSGLLVILVMASLGFLVDYTPVASLAGLLLVVCADLIEPRQIRQVLRSHGADRSAFTVTLLGTWFLHLDQAIYLGVGISLILFLQRERLLAVRAVGIDDSGRIREASVRGQEHIGQCASVHILNLEGPLFFGASSELQRALESHIHQHEVGVLIVRLKRTQHMDVTVARAFASVAAQLQDSGRRLVLVGLRDSTFRYVQRIELDKALGPENLFPTEAGFFAALEHAIEHAFEHLEEHHCEDGTCPLEHWLEARKVS